MSTIEHRPRPAQGDTDQYGYDDAEHRGAMAALGVGAVFALVGVLGFIPGVTHHIAFKAGERFSGPESRAMLFHLFQTSVLANLILIVFGLVAAVSSFFVLTTRVYFFVAAVVLAFFGAYGFAIDRSGPANFLPMNTASSGLHLGLAVVMLLFGIAVSVPRSR